MIFTIILLAVSLSLDAFGVGVSYGIRNIKIPFISKIFICIFSIIYSAGALAFGSSISAFISPGISKFIGSFILFSIGLWILIQAIYKDKNEKSDMTKFHNEEKTLFKLAIKSFGITIQIIKNPLEGDLDHSGIIDIQESILLGLALSVDAIGVGIGSALAGYTSILIPFSVGLFQLSSIYLGTFLGMKFGMNNKINKNLISILPGILLILLALIRI